jgi:hypothetical protein
MIPQQTTDVIDVFLGIGALILTLVVWRWALRKRGDGE